MDTAQEKKNGPYRILLLTNRDSDNVGDQVIEECDISLLHTVMKNLRIDRADYRILSRAAGIIPKKYVATGDAALLGEAEETIRTSDVIVFGGAPLFNYQHQIFYERTAVTLELAQKYGKPVIFSAIGIEGYSSKNKKCQRLKQTLNFDCVRQITTRDDLDALHKYVENERIVTGKVADPAVWCSRVFQDHISKKNTGARKKIGIFVLRANGFRDNKIDFTFDSATELWRGIAGALDKKGYDCEFLTSGHFSDESVLDYLARNTEIDEKKCIFNMNTPERLIQRVSSCDAVISCRLHPSIVAYALGVPSLGIVWNDKVKFFYEGIGCADRIVETSDPDPDRIVEKLERAISEGVEQDRESMVSVYRYLFEAFRGLLYPEGGGPEAYGFDELAENLPVFKGTSAKEYEEKLKRKFRRTYEKYNINDRRLSRLENQSVKDLAVRRLKKKAKSVLKLKKK